MKLFETIIDDGERVYKTYGCAKNKNEFLKNYSGNGEFVSVKDVTKEYLNASSLECLNDSLARTGWGIPEMTILCALLEEHLEKNKIGG